MAARTRGRWVAGASPAMVKGGSPAFTAYG